ncbi:DNA cytosine methyltransferase [Robertkochia aurantiaca]|uniref:DNA cytosine methyltransferase n=1 Tax=Robertkochia aurantiaca TaxID=2873700 RepID=UPI001CC94161|nr:DNA cytosine methyltransferase [Robertkochia sp. 3YJGBD-33]
MGEKSEKRKIPVIDLFAGPGGLGEGFMSVMDDENQSVFDIRVSIEKEENAHKTLTWRSFYRQFTKKGKKVPAVYYQVLKEKNLAERERLIEEALEKYPEGKEAREEACLIELGSEQWPPAKLDELIRNRLGKSPGNWVLIGGPPCQAYSNAGRSRVGGIHAEDHRVYLYKEYLRIIQEHHPAVFVMENVQGLLSASVNGEKVFDWMKNDLSCDGEYVLKSFVKEVEEDKDYLIKAEDYGVPQKRHRVILLGIRKDLNQQHSYLKRKPEVTLKSVIGKLPEIRSTLNRRFAGYKQNELTSQGKPKRIYEKAIDSDDNWKNLMNDFVTEIKGWGSLSLNGLSRGFDGPVKTTGSEFEPAAATLPKNHLLRPWYLDKRLKGVPNHESRSHLTQDLKRYLFATLFAESEKRSPKLDDFAGHHEDLIPDHSSADSGKFVDRFKVQLPDRAATTITSHISKDGHYFIHYDPKQCRSLTVREAARVQTFPDNYLFRGSRTKQFQQVGNAVPPFLANQIAEIVAKILD